MESNRGMSRRESLQWLGVGATTLAAGALTTGCQQKEQPKPAGEAALPPESPAVIADRQRRRDPSCVAGPGQAALWCPPNYWTLD